VTDTRPSCFADLRQVLAPNRPLNLKNNKDRIVALIDWNYTAYCKVRDQEVGGSNPLAPTNLIRSSLET
jgi:hypothetical protein